MKIISFAAAVLACATPMSAVAQETLTNDTVVMLTGAGLGESTIVAKVKSSASRFDTSTEKLIALKQKGVSDAVIAAMIEASGRSSVSANAFANSNSADPRAPHAAGIYMLADTETPARMMRIDVTSSNQTKTGGFLGYALTGGIAKVKINTVVPGQNARIRTKGLRPTFYFYFDQASASLSQGAPSGIWLSGGSSVVTSPSEFSLIRFDVKKGRREAAVGQFNLGGAKAGIQDKQRVAFGYEDVSPGVFKVTPQSDLKPGEYGFVFSSSSGGGGVGLYGAGATTTRIFDFSIEP